MKWTLARFLNCPHGNFGLLAHAGDAEDHFLFTCEDDWRGNQPNISCIPPGKYRLKRVLSPHFGDVFEIVGIPNRTKVLIHWGNTEEDTEGCVILGLSLGILAVARDEDTGRPAKKLAVLQSKAAFKRFMDAMIGVNDGDFEVIGDIK